MSGADAVSDMPPGVAPTATASDLYPRRGLFRKYIVALVVLVAAALCVNAGVEFWFSFRESKAALLALQQEKADAAAQRIGEFVTGVERQIGWTTLPLWGAAPIDQRRFDFVRLLRQVPAITDLTELDGDGKEQLKVSRLAMDVVGSGADYSHAPEFVEARAIGSWFSPVSFRKESEPYMTLALADAGRNSGMTVASINLKLIWDVITALKIGEGGYAYVVDGRGKLIADPDISLVLRDTDFSKLPQVAAALAFKAADGEPAQTPTATAADDYYGRPVLSAHARIKPVGWRVFVEVPLKEAYAPLYALALRNALWLVLALAGAALAAFMLARRMISPIRALQAGAAQLGAGDLDRRIAIRSGDELETLADQFNRMAGDLQKSYTELEQRVRDRTAELSEALDQQTATAEVLGVINSSPGELAPVFDAMLEKATKLCDAALGAMFRYDGARMNLAAMRGLPLADSGFFHSWVPGEGDVMYAIVHGAPLIHVLDIVDTDAYRSGIESRVRMVDVTGARTAVWVPLRKDDVLLGVIIAYRREVRPFTDKQIALLQNFAAQAVIAMENARLITETQEALDQQTATAEVLGVINSSPGDLTPVFDAILEKAHALCEVASGSLELFDGHNFHAVATRGLSDAFADMLRRGTPGWDNPLSRPLIDGEPFSQMLDVSKHEFPFPGGKGDGGVGAQTLLGVPLRRDDKLLGIIVSARTEVRPFSDKQIALLQNFAAQAVIAMENARLITETREALEQQTATAEILQVINSSPGDLAPVFEAILETAQRLCGVAFGTLELCDGQIFRAVATLGISDAFAALLAQGHPAGEGARRLIEGARYNHILDQAALTAPVNRTAVELDNHRTVLLIPLRREGQLLGMIVSARKEVRAFTEKEIALLENFAAQAVIAMENARLITETREALEQQTATAEVLGVINSSPGDLAPVFDAMLEKAQALCAVAQGSLQLYDGKMFRAVAVHNLPEPLADLLKQGYAPSRGMPNWRLLEGGAFAQGDMAEIDDPVARTAAESGIRTVLWVALRRDETLVGQIAAVRLEARPFAEKEIALLQNFAAQAVIAMENARLITETQEALDQQTATAEVLQVINANPGDLQPVFDVILEKAMALCDVAYGDLELYDGETFRAVATRGLTDAFAEQLRRGYPAGDNPATRPLIAGERLSHIVNMAEADFSKVFTHAPAKDEGHQTLLCVPLRRENALLGMIGCARREVRAFSEKEIALLESFAAQAVIAMDNARLLDEIRQRQQELRVTFDNMGDGVVMFDGDLRLAAWNKNFQELLDLPDDLVEQRKTYAEYLHVLAARGEFGPGDVEEELSRRLVRADEQLRFERTRPNGMILEVRRNAVAGGGFVLIYSDITERKRSEEEIRAARDAAEAALRDLQTAQRRLIQAEKMASLGQLTAGIAHEIKNPLNFVNNFASLSNELLSELKEVAEPAIAKLDPDRREELDETMAMLSGNLEKIAEHGRRADNIVKSMLEHSRGVSGERRAVDLNALVEDSLNLAYHGARAQDQSFNITLEREFDQKLQPIELVPQDMTRVFLNLIGNGFYAANKRAQKSGNGFRPVLRVATHEAGDAVEVKVRDNGTGIPADIRNKLFQPFFTTKPTGEGTGLGLSISYDIVTQQHGGTIAVDSAEDKFTEFTIRLPRQTTGSGASA